MVAVVVAVGRGQVWQAESIRHVRTIVVERVCLNEVVVDELEVGQIPVEGVARFVKKRVAKPAEIVPCERIGDERGAAVAA